MLLGNLQISKVDNLYADTTLLDSSAYMGQYNTQSVERLVNEQLNYKSQNINNLPESKKSAPKTFTEKIGYLRTTDQFLALVVNASNVATVCVDVAAMKAAGAESVLISLSIFFIELMGPKFTN